jgi:hypothetical protein
MYNLLFKTSIDIGKYSHELHEAISSYINIRQILTCNKYLFRLIVFPYWGFFRAMNGK